MATNSAEDFGKRTVQNTSFEDEGSSKKQHLGSSSDSTMSDSDTPSWAAALQSSLLRGQNEIRADIAEMNNALQGLRLDVNKQGNQIIEIDSRIEINDDRLERLENLVMELQGKNADLERDLDDVKGDVADHKGVVDEQIDRAMRDQLIFYGVHKESNERHWDHEHTTRVLAEWLATAAGKPCKYFDEAIERAHRGPVNPEKTGPPVIYCKFRWRVAEEIRNLFMAKSHKIGAVTIKNNFSKATGQRVNDALIYRKKLRAEEGGAELKLKVDYPARLMVKAPGASKYTLKKAF
jgi:hypothetical protein